MKFSRPAAVLQWLVLCAVAGVMYVHWTHVRMLRAELAGIQQRFTALETPGSVSGICCGVAERHVFLHLVPVSSQSYDEDDVTVLSWAVGQSRGDGLQVSGDTVTVVTEGTYFVYSQVLYKDITWVMGHVITKRHKGAESKLMKCLTTMPNNISQPLNTCYTAGIYLLESGSTLQLSVPRRSAELILTAHATFMGILKI